MKKRVLALTLAALLLMGCLVGCGDNSETPSNEKETASNPKEETTSVPSGYAYKASYYPLDFGGLSIDYINYFCASGSNMYFTASYSTGEMIEETDLYSGETYEYEGYETGLFRIDMETRTVAKLDGYQPYEIPEGMQGSSYVNSMNPGADGTVWISESYSTYFYDLPEDFEAGVDDPSMYYTPGENATRLCQYGPDGSLLQTVDFQIGDDVYLSNIYVDGSGCIYATDWESFYIFDTTGALLATLPNENYGDLICLGSQIGVRTWKDDGSVSFQPIDPETKTLGEEVPLNSRVYNTMPGFDVYDYTYNYNGTLYAHDSKTGEDEKLLSFLDCDVNSNYVSRFMIQEDGTVVAIEEDSSNGWPPVYNLLILEKVDASTLPQKQELTMACVYLSWDLRSEIINFNKSHSDVRITVKDYSEYNTDDDYTAGVTKLNTEILSGVIPDILYLNGNLPVKRYAAKGLLTDLWELIDNDPELSRDDLMTHFFDVLSMDGKLYQITDSFTVQSAVGLKAVVGDRTSWTLDELLDTLATLEPDATIFGEGDTKEGVLDNCVSRNIDGFIDWSNPVSPCSFDSQEFIDLLKFVDTFPKEFDWNNYDWENYESDAMRMRKGQQLLQRAYIGSFDDLQYTKVSLGNQEISFIGYPSSSGTGSNFNSYEGLAITAACKNVDAAWSFVRNWLTEDYQTKDYMYEFPTNRHAFETMAERAMTQEYTEDPETGEQIPVMDTYWFEDGEVQVGPLTQEEYDAFMQLYESCNSIYSYDEAILNIIKEEIEPFFDGQKTAEETARLIQNRVSLYVAEQG
ncbi:MAG: hypothetical protein ACI4PT_04490 [Candidatus Avoscillospira sp.]